MAEPSATGTTHHRIIKNFHDARQRPGRKRPLQKFWSGHFHFRERMKQGTQSVVAVEPNPFEPHYTTKEVAELWKLDVSTVRRLFCDEPGVIKFGKLGRRDGKRDYITLRIPESVVRRVHAKRIERGF